MAQQQQPTVIPQEMMAAQQQQIPNMQHPPVNINSYYPEAPGGDLSGGLPINLDSLRDGPPGSKPFYPYSTLIRYAIKGAPNQKLLLEDIYYAIESRFPYFRSAPPGWKNSVRHNLSLNPCFEKVPRPLTDRGKGSYWTVNDNVDPRTGVHRVRKKKPKGGKKGGQHRHVEQSPEQEQQDQQPQQQQAQPQPSQQPPIEDVDYHPGAAQEANAYDPSNYVPPPIIAADGPGPSRQPQTQAPQPAQFQPPYGTVLIPFPASPYRFDPAFSFPPQPMRPHPLFPDEQVDLDEHGNVIWASMWRKELTNLMQFTDQQEKQGADQEWFRNMLARVRTAMMAPQVAPEAMPQPAHGMPGAPPSTGETA
ncbi:uncharacterized protein PHACADRAFT_249397 [Phanerochaete carnosa HHB-10118-sp]|uniref:Fork-head domain-containing protein n=1 Tax=Phanerochaete carnosa (strain HHB-10118-sp) TaxID=650164 RepID=K5WJ51_PHACS|nr:uncharacterized protein PHACADRAFT_249397 [Phanerochaete carnosa HHB-10118-sp]EKM59149.1 hypothetical protein PHACADRAFT_249397 [Phanerochaete carnosa HHB-10118-sp]